MEKLDVQRFKTLLEVRQQELRQSIEHNLQSTRTALSGRALAGLDKAGWPKHDFRVPYHTGG